MNEKTYALSVIQNANEDFTAGKISRREFNLLMMSFGALAGYTLFSSYANAWTGTRLRRSASGSGSNISMTYVDDVFSTYTYTGNGNTQIISNGINLADGAVALINPGTALAGGYYAGMIKQSDGIYALIIAPRSGGQLNSSTWQNNENVNGNTSQYDGLYNTNLTNTAGHYVSLWARALSIGGFSDWYIPANEEFKILYWNLKYDSSTSHVDPESGCEANIYSVPPTPGMIASLPTVTTASLFTTGNSEAMDQYSQWWTSTESVTAGYGTYRYSNTGNGGSGHKTLSSYAARAVRRVKITDASVSQYFTPSTGKGGMVWVKGRSAAWSHYLFDTVRGTEKSLTTNNTDAQTSTSDLDIFNSNGFSMTHFGGGINSASPNTYASWTFRKAAKFFDVVTYSGDGLNNHQIPHNLGAAPGMIIIKAIDAGYDWHVWHKNLSGDTKYLILNSTAAQGDQARVGVKTSQTASYITVSHHSGNGGYGETNQTGNQYVAYIFAHDASADGIIQCGSYVGNGSTTGPIVTLGWEPQYVMIKKITAIGGSPGNWIMADSMRGFSANSNNVGTFQKVFANLTNAESSENSIGPLATGFQVYNNDYNTNNSGDTYIYMAIRRPNKPPTLGTQVFKAIARTGTGAVATVTGVGFAPDLLIGGSRRPDLYGQFGNFVDKLRGSTNYLRSGSTSAEINKTDGVTSFTPDGVVLDADATPLSFNYNTGSHINYFFRRAPEVFEVVCYRGTSNPTTVAHKLGAIPELIIIKARGNGTAGPYNWCVYCAPLGNLQHLILNTTAAVAASTYWNSTEPTASVFSLSSSNPVNDVENYVAYLFATKAGISKVGSYTGNGGSQTINCAFTTGARFILIKRTDSTGDWYTWDNVRTILAGNDPHLSLNTTAAEVTTDDSIDPDSSGFIVNQVAATNINVTSATYIFLAIA